LRGGEGTEAFGSTTVSGDFCDMGSPQKKSRQKLFSQKFFDPQKFDRRTAARIGPSK
jgi:hypothetical protein